MPEKIISALPVLAVAAVSPPNPPMYRSKKKLRMESHYFNTTLYVPKTHELRRPSNERVKAVEVTFPTTKYRMNSNTWFQHAFGDGSDCGPTQASSEPYNGKTFNGRPKHYNTEWIEKKIPTNLQGFNQLYKVGPASDEDYEFLQTGEIDFTRVVMDPLTPVSIQSDKKSAAAAAPTVTSEAKKPRKRSFPSEFVREVDTQRGQARARIEENWKFGRALAKKHVHSLWRDAIPTNEVSGVGQEQEVTLDALGGGKQQFYDGKGNKSFLYLQLDVVMSPEDMIDRSLSPISPV